MSSGGSSGDEDPLKISQETNLTEYVEDTTPSNENNRGSTDAIEEFEKGESFENIENEYFSVDKKPLQNLTEQLVSINDEIAFENEEIEYELTTFESRRSNLENLDNDTNEFYFTGTIELSKSIQEIFKENITFLDSLKPTSTATEEKVEHNVTQQNSDQDDDEESTTQQKALLETAWKDNIYDEVIEDQIDSIGKIFQPTTKLHDQTEVSPANNPIDGVDLSLVTFEPKNDQVVVTEPAESRSFEGETATTHTTGTSKPITSTLSTTVLQWFDEDYLY